MGTIYQCLKRDDRYTPPMMTVVHEAKSSSDAVRWLENNGGGIFRDLLHNFDCGVAAKGRNNNMQHRYLVTWEMDIYADSPREAAEKAWGHMRAPDSSANVFNVLDKNGVGTIIDLSEEQQS